MTLVLLVALVALAEPDPTTAQTVRGVSKQLGGGTAECAGPDHLPAGKVGTIRFDKRYPNYPIEMPVTLTGGNLVVPVPVGAGTGVVTLRTGQSGSLSWSPVAEPSQVTECQVSAELNAALAAATTDSVDTESATEKLFACEDPEYICKLYGETLSNRPEGVSEEKIQMLEEVYASCGCDQ